MTMAHGEDWAAPGYCLCGRWARARVVRSGPGKGAVLDGCPGLAAVEEGRAVPVLEPIVWTLVADDGDLVVRTHPWRRT